MPPPSADTKPHLHSVSSVTVWHGGSEFVTIHVAEGSSFSDVQQAFDDQGLGISAAQPVPIYPQPGSSWQCVAVPCGCPADSAVVLLQMMPDAQPILLLLQRGSTAKEIMFRHGRTDWGRVNLAGRRWTTTDDGFFHGMFLQVTKTPHTSDQANCLRPLPTPYRNRTGRRKVCLWTALRNPVAVCP